jgi:DNA-directed RNA polymerase specialized sigma subunit
MSHQFFTFYDFISSNGYPPFKPLIQHRLRNRLEKLINLHPEWQEKDYFQYFATIFQDDSQSELEQRLAHWHLLAYFDLERCYLIWRNFHYLPFYAAKSDTFYELTNEILCRADKLQKYLNKYNSQDVSGASIKTYIAAVLKNCIKEQLNFRSGWHLLCDVDVSSLRKLNNAGQKLRKALEKYGIREPNLSRYIFAWQYFVPVYKNNRLYNINRKKQQKWPEPEQLDFVETANCYNTQRFQPDAPLQASTGSDITPETIAKWMKICVEALQQTEKFTEFSRDETDYEKQEEEIISWIPLESAEEPTNSLKQVEMVLLEELQKIEANLDKIRSNIPSQFRRAVMPLCYSHQLALLNQEQLGNLLGIHQGTISRYISKYIETPLLNKLESFLADKFKPEFYLNSFLETRFDRLNADNILDRFLLEALQSLSRESQQIIKLRYGQKISISEIMTRLECQKDMSQKEIEQLLINAKNMLLQAFIEKTFDWRAEYIKAWLRNYYRNSIQSILLKYFEQLDSFQKEIMQRRYVQKMNEDRISNLYHQNNVGQIIWAAKQQLQRSLLQWIERSFSLSLNARKEQIMEIIENWLSRDLIYLEI